MVARNCQQCGKEFSARQADVNRGWAKFCSKSCKAKKQTRETGITGPHYKALGMTVKQMRKGDFAKSKYHGNRKLPKEITHDEYGFRKKCYCGEIATHFIASGFGHNGWEGLCSDHVDDIHPHDSSNFDW